MRHEPWCGASPENTRMSDDICNCGYAEYSDVARLRKAEAARETAERERDRYQSAYEQSQRELKGAQTARDDFERIGNQFAREKETAERERDKWFVESQRLAIGLLDTFEEQANEDGELAPEQATDTAFRLLDEWVDRAKAAERERDELKLHYDQMVDGAEELTNQLSAERSDHAAAERRLHALQEAVTRMPAWTVGMSLPDATLDGTWVRKSDVAALLTAGEQET